MRPLELALDRRAEPAQRDVALAVELPPRERQAGDDVLVRLAAHVAAEQQRMVVGAVVGLDRLERVERAQYDRAELLVWKRHPCEERVVLQ